MDYVPECVLDHAIIHVWDVLIHVLADVLAVLVAADQGVRDVKTAALVVAELVVQMDADQDVQVVVVETVVEHVEHPAAADVQTVVIMPVIRAVQVDVLEVVISAV